MATDYDSPRKTDEDINEDSLQELQARRVDKGTGTIDVDPDEVAEGMELPRGDRRGSVPRSRRVLGTIGGSGDPPINQAHSLQTSWPARCSAS